MKTGERFCRTTVMAELFDRRLNAREAYRRAAGKPHDEGNGWAQVPEGNAAAQRAYGAIETLAGLMLEFRA